MKRGPRNGVTVNYGGISLVCPTWTVFKTAWLCSIFVDFPARIFMQTIVSNPFFDQMYWVSTSAEKGVERGIIAFLWYVCFPTRMSIDEDRALNVNEIYRKLYYGILEFSWKRLLSNLFFSQKYWFSDRVQQSNYRAQCLNFVVVYLFSDDLNKWWRYIIKCKINYGTSIGRNLHFSWDILRVERTGVSTPVSFPGSF